MKTEIADDNEILGRKMWRPPMESIQPTLPTTTKSSQTAPHEEKKVELCASFLGLLSFICFTTSIILIILSESANDKVSFRTFSAVLMPASLILALVTYGLYRDTKASKPCTVLLECQTSTQDRTAAPSMVLDKQGCVTRDVCGSNLRQEMAIDVLPPPYEENVDPSQVQETRGSFFLELNTSNLRSNNELSYLPSYDEATESDRRR